MQDMVPAEDRHGPPATISVAQLEDPDIAQTYQALMEQVLNKQVSQARLRNLCLHANPQRWQCSRPVCLLDMVCNPVLAEANECAQVCQRSAI